MSKPLNNLPIEDLTEENDYLGIIDKGQIIKTFLESNTDEFKDIKMFTLYGEWGSGKSTLMKYLKKELKSTFNTFFFEAWQYESDDNLSLSLLEYLSYKSSDSTEEALGEIVDIAAKLFKGFSKSIRITVPGLSIDGSKIVESLEDKPEETFYQLKKKFETEFRKWEVFTTKGKKPKFNIVFIDDLDRCEPENVLNLLSALKLFFTYGEKTIFFCGVDKKAVNQAVETKYGKVVKANEYLEKVFDISFSVPKHQAFLKLTNQYFPKERFESENPNLSKDIFDFLVRIKFTNPRRVKKVLNKFLIIQNLKESELQNSKLSFRIPSILTSSGGNLLESVVVIYLIILNEFYPNILENTFNLNLKLKVFEKAIESRARLDSINNMQSHIANSISKANGKFSFAIEKIVNDKLSLKDIFTNNYALSQSDERVHRYVENLFFINTLFCPYNILSMSINSLVNYEQFKSNFKVENTLIDYYFTEYLFWLFSKSKEFNELSLIPMIEFKDLIKNIC